MPPGPCTLGTAGSCPPGGARTGLGIFIDDVGDSVRNSRDALDSRRNGVGALPPGDVGDVALE